MRIDELTDEPSRELANDHRQQASVWEDVTWPFKASKRVRIVTNKSKIKSTMKREWDDP